MSLLSGWFGSNAGNPYPYAANLGNILKLLEDENAFDTFIQYQHQKSLRQFVETLLHSESQDTREAIIKLLSHKQSIAAAKLFGTQPGQLVRELKRKEMVTVLQNMGPYSVKPSKTAFAAFAEKVYDTHIRHENFYDDQTIAFLSMPHFIKAIVAARKDSEPVIQILRAADIKDYLSIKKAEGASAALIDAGHNDELRSISRSKMFAAYAGASLAMLDL